MESQKTKTYILYLRASKSGKRIGSVRGRNQSGLAEIIFGFQIADFGLVRPIHNTDRNRKYCIALSYGK